MHMMVASMVLAILILVAFCKWVPVYVHILLYLAWVEQLPIKLMCLPDVCCYFSILFCYTRWMDKLGATARSNYSRVFRQTFVGGFYGLLNADYQPVPVSCQLYNNTIIACYHISTIANQHIACSHMLCTHQDSLSLTPEIFPSTTDGKADYVCSWQKLQFLINVSFN